MLSDAERQAASGEASLMSLPPTSFPNLSQLAKDGHFGSVGRTLRMTSARGLLLGAADPRVANSAAEAEAASKQRLRTRHSPGGENEA